MSGRIRELERAGQDDLAAVRAIVATARDGAERAQAFRRAAEPPARIARHADEIARLADIAAREGAGIMRGDALVAGILARAASRSARLIAAADGAGGGEGTDS